MGYSIEIDIDLSSEVSEFIKSAVKHKVIDACDDLILHILQPIIDDIGMQGEEVGLGDIESCIREGGKRLVSAQQMRSVLFFWRRKCVLRWRWVVFQVRIISFAFPIVGDCWSCVIIAAVGQSHEADKKVAQIGMEGHSCKYANISIFHGHKVIPLRVIHRRTIIDIHNLIIRQFWMRTAN